MNGALTWLSRMLSESDGTPSSKRTAFVLTVGVMCGIAIALTCITCTDKALAAQTLQDIVPWLAAAGGFGYVGGKVADKRGGGGNVSNSAGTN